MDDETLEPTSGLDEPRHAAVSQRVLYGALAVLVVAVGSDVLVARRRWRGAIDRLNAKIRGPIGEATVVRVDPLTRDEVSRLIGRAPAEITEGATYYLECYRWRRGLPWKHYDLYVIYSKGTIPLLHDISYPGPPDPSQFP